MFLLAVCENKRVEVDEGNNFEWFNFGCTR